MVVDQADRVFHALADGTRRDIVQRTLQQDLSVSDLARSYPMSFAAVQKHVVVLADAGLVTKRRSGRAQLVRGNAEQLRAAARALDALEATWRDRVDRMADVLAEDDEEGSRT